MNMQQFKLSSLFLATCICLCLSAQVQAQEAQAQEKKPATEQSTMLGMNVLANKESPRSLTIVPWRESTLIGKSLLLEPIWQPKLKLLQPKIYRREINVFLKHRHNKANKD
jgi:hypothetical protein